MNKLASAVSYVEWLRTKVHGKALPATTRTRASASCLAIAQDHHHAIALLITEHRLFASSFALLRLEFEAYIRGTWLALAACDIQVQKFMEGDFEPPKIERMLKAIEIDQAFADRAISKVKEAWWNSMCDFSHTGGLHVQRWGTKTAIEPNYSAAEIEEVLSFAEVVGSLAVVGVLELGEHMDDALSVFKRFESRYT